MNIDKFNESIFDAKYKRLLGSRYCRKTDIPREFDTISEFIYKSLIGWEDGKGWPDESLLYDGSEMLGGRRWMYLWSMINGGKLNSSMTVLDLGAHDVSVQFALAKLGLNVTSADFSDSNLLAAIRRGVLLGLIPKMTFRLYDMRSSIILGKFDRVYCISVLEHVLPITSRIKSYKNIADMVIKNGKALISVDISPNRLEFYTPSRIMEMIDVFQNNGLILDNSAVGEDFAKEPPLNAVWSKSKVTWAGLLFNKT